MFIKTSHPPGDNSWCWALGVICPWCCWHWHRAPGHLTIVSRDAITGILFTSGGVNIETWEELSPTTNWQREIWLWRRARGFLSTFKRFFYEKSRFMIPGSNTLWERFCWKPGAEVSQWTAGIRMDGDKENHLDCLKWKVFVEWDEDV